MRTAPLSRTDRALDLARRLDALPRFPLAHLPTPLDDVPWFSKAVGDVRILIKREDMTGLAFGGNKTRELDYIVGAAKQAGATVFIAGGGAAQSNHAVQCAAAARRAGMTPVMVLHRYRDVAQGNVLLDRLMDVDLRLVDTKGVDSAIDQRTALQNVMQEAAAEYRAKGEVPYILPSSFHPLAAASYAGCALEIQRQLDERGLAADHVYLTSSGATQTGLALGAKHLGLPWRVTGIRYTAATDDLAARMAQLSRDTAAVLGIETTLTPEEILGDVFAGAGYGIPTPEGVDAIKLLARTEGMFVDPVYTGKGLSGLVAHVRAGRIRAGATVVFVHTGGLPAIFAYADELLG